MCIRDRDGEAASQPDELKTDNTVKMNTVTGSFVDIGIIECKLLLPIFFFIA